MNDGDRGSPVFGYWTSGAPSPGVNEQVEEPIEGRASWKTAVPGFRVVRDDEVLRLLGRWGPRFQDLFRDIRLAACRADIARLVLLRAYGGLYVDAHSAPGNSAALARLLDHVSQREIVFFDEQPVVGDRPQTWVINSVIGARAGSPLLDLLICCALSNLLWHRENEQNSPTRVEYSIYGLTGPRMIVDCLFQRGPDGAELKPEYRGRIDVLPLDRSMDAPFCLYRYNRYRTAALHWSRREKTERLFPHRVPAEGTTGI